MPLHTLCTRTPCHATSIRLWQSMPNKGRKHYLKGQGNIGPQHGKHTSWLYLHIITLCNDTDVQSLIMYSTTLLEHSWFTTGYIVQKHIYDILCCGAVGLWKWNLYPKEFIWIQDWCWLGLMQINYISYWCKWSSGLPVLTSIRNNA